MVALIRVTRRLLLILTVVTFPSAAQSVDWSAVHESTMRGIDRLYSLDFDDAVKAFDEASSRAPADPRAVFFKSMVYFYVYQLTKSDTAYEAFFALSEEVIEKAESILENSPEDLNAKFYLGGILGYRGLAYQRSGNLLGALWDGRKGYGYLREAATGERYSIDARMGFGLFTYLVSRIPRSYSWVLNILGFSGDREGGLEMMRAAADSGVYTRTEAAFYYAQFCFFERRYDEAYRYIRRIMDRYPRNTLFLVTFAAWELRQDRVDEAIQAAERAIAVNDENNIRVGDEFAHSTLAAAYFIRNEFQRAIDHWHVFIDGSENKENVGNYVYYRMGLSYEILGDRGTALEIWGRMKRSTDEDRPWESVYWRRGQTHVRSPLTPSDLLIVSARNIAQAGMKKEASELFSVAAKIPGGSRDQQAVAQFELVAALEDCGELSEIPERVQELLRMRVHEERWVFPHALYRLGRVYQTLGRNADARAALRQALAYDDYDWSVNLRERIEEELDGLEEAD